MNAIDIEMIDDQLERWNFIKENNEMVDQEKGEYVKYSDLESLCKNN